MLLRNPYPSKSQMAFVLLGDAFELLQIEWNDFSCQCDLLLFLDLIIGLVRNDGNLFIYIKCNTQF